jgi:hypothetical protein
MALGLVEPHGTDVSQSAILVVSEAARSPACGKKEFAQLCAQGQDKCVKHPAGNCTLIGFSSFENGLPLRGDGGEIPATALT